MQWLNRLICKVKGHKWAMLGLWGYNDCERCGKHVELDPVDYTEWEKQAKAMFSNKKLRDLE